MEMIDSKQRLVEGPSIIPMAISNLGVEHFYPKKELSFQQAMIATARETTLDKADTVQAGNTIFLSHKKDKGKMAGRIFNVDTPKNFVVKWGFLTILLAIRLILLLKMFPDM
jgi:hypothetical protein